MRRLLWVVVALGFGFSPPTENGEDAKRFVGTWKLVSIESEGQPDPRGAHPVGLIYYDTAGNMAAQIMPDRDRPKWKLGEPPTPEQAKEAITGYAAYFGTYTLDENYKELVSLALTPSKMRTSGAAAAARHRQEG